MAYEINWTNLETYLAWAKENLKEKSLDMNRYSNGDIYSKEPENICGTAACFLGWAPMFFGVEVSDYNKDDNFSYEDFCERVFMPIHSISWEWLFSSYWPNDLEAALNRLEYLIENKCPPELCVWEELGYEG